METQIVIPVESIAWLTPEEMAFILSGGMLPGYVPLIELTEEDILED
jgi:hypothetical protein